MNSGYILSLVGSTCDPEKEKDFNEWYDSEHIPINMSFKDLLGVTRYRLVRSYDWAQVKEYPTYLATYRFASLDTFKAWTASSAFAESCKNMPDVLSRTGAKISWRAQYQCLETWQKTLPHSVITLVGVRYPAENEAKFDSWYIQKHIPEVLKFPKLLGVGRYKLAGPLPRPGSHGPEYPQNLSFYHFDNTRSFENVRAADAYDNSAERTTSHQDFSRIAAETGATMAWRAQYDPLKTWLR